MLDELSGWVAAQASQAAQLAERLSQISETAVNRDGGVEVTVGPAGDLTDLRLDDSVRQWPAERIAAEILATMRDAQATRRDRIAVVVAATVGTDTATGRAVLAGVERDEAGGEARHGGW
jgi:hypothetical protein